MKKTCTHKKHTYRGTKQPNNTSVQIILVYQRAKKTVYQDQRKQNVIHVHRSMTKFVSLFCLTRRPSNNKCLQGSSSTHGRHRSSRLEHKTKSHPCHPRDLRQGRAGQVRFPAVNEAAVVAALEGVPLVLDEHELCPGVRRLPGHVPVVHITYVALIYVVLVSHVYFPTIPDCPTTRIPLSISAREPYENKR